MDKRLKILLEEVKGSDPNLDTMDRNTIVRAGNYRFPFSGQQLDYLLLTLAKKLSDGDVLVFSNPSDPETVLSEITKYQLNDPSKIHTSYEVVFGTYIGTLRIDSQDTASVSILQSGKILYCSMNLTNGQVTLEKEIQLDDIANSLYQYLGFTEEELTAEQFKNGLKNAILAYKDGPIA